MYCIHIQGKSEYLLEYDTKHQLVRGTPHLVCAETFNTYLGAAEMVRLLAKAGICGQVVSRDDEAARAVRRRKVESSVPPEWQWLIPLIGTAADGRSFIQANGQTVYASTAAELVQKVDALADSFKEWRDWLAANKPIPQLAAPVAPPPVYAVVIRGRDDVWRYKTEALPLDTAEKAASACRARGIDPHDVQIVRVEG